MTQANPPDQSTQGVAETQPNDIPSAAPGLWERFRQNLREGPSLLESFFIVAFIAIIANLAEIGSFILEIYENPVASARIGYRPYVLFMLYCQLDKQANVTAKRLGLVPSNQRKRRQGKMHIVKEYPDGIFAWVDLQTPDIVGAKAFYRGLFGWELDDRPTGGGPPYTMALIDGHTVAGMGPMTPEMVGQGMPAFWSSYIKHDNVDAVVAKATAAGGTVVMPPMDVMTEGRMAMIQDPSGAIVGVWQPGNHKGAEVVNSANSLVWNELQTHDTAAARDFYGKVFDWTDKVDDRGYIAFALDDRTHAGGMGIQPDWGEVPPNWSVYFLVEDMDAMVARVRELGGSVLNGPFPVGEMGHAAVVADPQGGVFNLIMYNVPADTPPGV